MKGGGLMQQTLLTKDEEEKLKQSLLDFVLSVSSSRYAPQYVLELLPAVSDILLTHFRF